MGSREGRKERGRMRKRGGTKEGKEQRIKTEGPINLVCHEINPLD